MAQFEVRNVVDSKGYLWHCVWYDHEEITSFPSPDYTWLNIGQSRKPANPLYGRYAPIHHDNIRNLKDVTSKMWKFVLETRKGKNPILPLEFYDAFGMRDNG